MYSLPIHQTVVYDPSVAGSLNYHHPPPPRDAPYSSPLRRQHALHPPVLTTSIPTIHEGSNYSTPLSGVVRHSPFSAVPSTPAIASVATPITASPMASRLSGHFAVPYDPRDWAPGTDTRAAQVQRARENAAADGLASPPPPYSPATPSPNGGQSPHMLEARLERAQTTAVRHLTAPATQFSQQRAFSTSNAPPSSRHSIHVGSYIPPPPPSQAPPMPIRNRTVSDMQGPPGSIELVHDQGLHPPAARRAASASAEILRGSEAGPSRSSSRQRNWAPGMPLPGPPPGPPPSTSRSQSTSGVLDRMTSQQRQRALRQTVPANDLGPVPLTPMNWTDDQPMPIGYQHSSQDASLNVTQNHYTNLNNDSIRRSSTSNGNISTTYQGQVEIGQSVASPPTNLSRSSAVRDNSVKGLRERRAQHRNSVVFNIDSNPLSVSTNPWADAVNNSTGDVNNTQQEIQPLTSPRPALQVPNAPSPLSIVISNTEQFSASPVQLTSTPPVSPSPAQHQTYKALRPINITPKALPTPPDSQKAPFSGRSTTQPSRDIIISPPGALHDVFQREAAQRHNDFLERERLAASDADRLQLFASYILQEATLRQNKYQTAFLSGSFNVEKFRHDLFKSQADNRSASNSVSQVTTNGPNRTSGEITPQTRPETMWWKDYKPELSPIASMDYDEMSSRGRATSRWWESGTDSQSGGGPGGRSMKRSKRESKYMGLSKEFLMLHSPSEEYPGPFNPAVVTNDTSSYPDEKANPDTFGYFEIETPRQVSDKQSKKPEEPALLDVSRFITLPPPYPRHYPAVNNNHPELAQYRTTVRTLSDLGEVKTRRNRHKSNLEAMQAEHKRRLSDSRRTFKSNVQAQVAEGSLSFAEAAEAEEAFKLSEFEAEKQSLQSEFDTLQDVVINPLHDMLHERITQLNTSVQQLQDDLHTDARYQDPDQPQAEGDEKPELLEKLTQLKWLFDVREQIYRECFELLSERNDKFKAIVLLPCRFTNNMEKVRDTEQFFDKDTQNRYIGHCNEAFKRHESFLQIIEQHVSRGVELQSSAFWDLVPGLLDLVQKIPEDLQHFPGIQIPDKEYTENPSYHKHPQQYLYSLLAHAETSTYQFIEGQVNLQCLLHEVKTGLLVARYRTLEAEGGNVTATSTELSDVRSQEEAALTGELKQKASMIEEQWLEALGSQLQATRERVKKLLQENDAWEEIAEEDA